MNGRNANFDPQNDLDEIFQQALGGTGRFNVLVLGRTGVGKSTLINAFFSGKVAAVGIGKPVTQDTTLYEHPSGLLGVYDTKGVEVGDGQARIIGWIREELARPRDDEHTIHLAWFCVGADDARMDDGQRDILGELAAARIPTIVVVTKVHLDASGEIDEQHAEFLHWLDKSMVDDGPARAVVGLAAQRSRTTPTQHGLDRLLSTSSTLVADEVEAALLAAQRVRLDQQRSKAADLVHAAAAAAGLAAAVPLPGTSAALVPIQLEMVARISAAYALPVPHRELTRLVAPIVVGSSASFVGKSIATSLLKFVPGVNILVTGINVAIAVALTEAAGWAWIGVCEMLVEQDLSVLDQGAVAVLRDEFARRMKDRFNGGATGAGEAA